jgi:hypothetical protein
MQCSRWPLIAPNLQIIFKPETGDLTDKNHHSLLFGCMIDLVFQKDKSLYSKMGKIFSSFTPFLRYLIICPASFVTR